MAEIHKKFNKLTTKEWNQYFQNKLSPEREKQLMEHLPYDPFLKEAVDTINEGDVKSVAYNSLQLIHAQIEEITGVGSTSNYNASSTNNFFSSKAFKIGLFILVLLGVIGLGLWLWYIFNRDMSIKQLRSENEEIETVEMVKTDLPNPNDSLLINDIQPIQTNSASSISIPSSSSVNNNSITNPSFSNPIDNSKGNNTKPTSTPAPAPAPSTSEYRTVIVDNDANLKFQKAQELYKNNKINEAKVLLKELRNTELRDKAETALKNIGE
ncbi:MAG: hypothetical protein MUE53_00560 [Chitinophagales bacterium]|jgi:hypothetical protein|nr:hypothetical protein [Chitinophagales bacterium]